MQKDFSGDHATDEEKLASSVGVKPDKDESSEWKWSMKIDFDVVLMCTCQSAPQLQFSAIQWWIAQLLSGSVKDATVQRSDYWMLKFRQHALASLDQ